MLRASRQFQRAGENIDFMPKTLNLKSTLNLPQTAFPMKANLPQNEPRMLAEWEESRLYHRIQQARAGAPSYILHDGPPYPTGTIHLGTGLNKIVKDMVVKSKTMAGFRSPYVPGWDCHGLPIETQVEKELGKKGNVSPTEFRRMCREFALRYVDQHRRDFKRLGVFGRWEKPYLTMDPHNEATIAGAFLTFLEKGYVYRGLKPVYWCMTDRTALAEAEVEYEDHTSPSIWVRYAVVDSPHQPAKKQGGFYALVWTTTPWTLPASMALAFHPRFNYVLATDEQGDTYIVAEELLKRAAGTNRLASCFHHGSVSRKRVQRGQVSAPVPRPHRTRRAGRACHARPGQRHRAHRSGPAGSPTSAPARNMGCKLYAPLDDDGRFTEGLPEYKGKTVFEANPAVIALLKSRGALVHETKLQHSYPHCWRCHKPVIFRATEQWFVQLDNGGPDIPPPIAPPLRERALAEIAKVTWTPAWGRDRIHDMIAERPDWCISRQRFWGVPAGYFLLRGLPGTAH